LKLRAVGSNPRKVNFFSFTIICVFLISLLERKKVFYFNYLNNIGINCLNNYQSNNKYDTTIQFWRKRETLKTGTEFSILRDSFKLGSLSRRLVKHVLKIGGVGLHFIHISYILSRNNYSAEWTDVDC
jgi:hypothetical protein